MLILLTAVAFSIGSPVSQASHHDFRLPVDMATRKEMRCPTSHGVTVCAERAEAQLRWRVSRDELPADRASGPHVTSLRLQPARCTNPAEDGLRCVKPTALVRVNLDD